MSRLFSNKYSLTALVALAVLIPLNMIQGLVAERERTHRQAIDEMSASATGPQSLTGPVLVVPCVEDYPTEVVDPRTHETRVKRETRDCTRYVLPTRLELQGTLGNDLRRRGIHSALFYVAELGVKAHFEVPDSFGSGAADTKVTLGVARVAVGIRDPRGVLNVPSLTLDDVAMVFAPGASLSMLGPGIHADLGQLPPGRRINVGFPLRLRGLERLDIVPLGRETFAHMESKWPHPSFDGRFLPASRQVSRAGFTAEWSTSHFATGLEEIFARNVRAATVPDELAAVNFGVTLMDPVDLYTQTDRALKYGFLFVLLTFVALLGTELARGLRLHPMQYAMVGVALAVFFLLLLSLSEHVGFTTAYASAATACILLLSYYLRHTMRSVGLGAAYGVTLTLLYGLMFGLLCSEDYALLAGSIFVFGVLATLMVATRHVDWYRLGPAVPGPQPEPAPKAE